MIHPHSSVNNKTEMFVIFHCKLDNCQDIVCCHEPFRWQSFFLCVCERFIIYIIAFPLFFRGGGGSFDKSLKDIRII